MSRLGTAVAVFAAIFVARSLAGAEEQAPAEKILARGVLTVSVASDAAQHHVHILDKHGHTLELIFDDPLDTLRATITPFGERNLHHVTLFVDGKKPYHVEHHYVVRASVDAELELVCDLPGSSTAPPEPATAVTLRRVSSKPLRFDLDTRSGGATKRQRFTIPPGQLCDNPETVAVTTPAEEASVKAALAAGKYRDAKVFGNAGRGSFVAVGQHGTVDEPNERLLLVTPGATPAIVVLGVQVGMHRANDGLRVEGYGPFLGRRELSDLQISSSWSNGMGGSSTTTHYLLRGGRAPQLACTLEGDSSGGMEDVSHSASTSFEQLSDEPFTFAIKRTQSDHDPRHSTPIGSMMANEQCSVPSKGLCDCNLGR